MRYRLPQTAYIDRGRQGSTSARGGDADRTLIGMGRWAAGTGSVGTSLNCAGLETDRSMNFLRDSPPLSNIIASLTRPV
jgi:hypothetical protein